jgi:hypothetical protein
MQPLRARHARVIHDTSQRCGMAHRVHERAVFSSVIRLYILQSKKKTLPLRSTKTPESSTVIACVLSLPARTRERTHAITVEDSGVILTGQCSGSPNIPNELLHTTGSSVQENEVLYLKFLVGQFGR